MAEKQPLGPDEQFCSSCGEVIKKEAEICPKCGVRIKVPPAVTSEKKKSSKLKIGCLSIIGIFVLIIVIVLASSGGQENGSAAEDAPILYPGRPDSQDKDIEIAVGDTGNIKGWAVAVRFEETASSLGAYENAEAGSRFVVFNVTVKRTGDGSANLLGQNMFSSEFRLVTPGGQVLDPSMSSKTPELDPGDMVSGGEVSGYLTYEVRTKSGMHYLLFKPDMFSSSRLVWGIEIP